MSTSKSKRKEKIEINVIDSPDVSFLDGKKLKPSDHIVKNDSKDPEWVQEYYNYIKMLLSKVISHMDSELFTLEDKTELLQALLIGSDKNNKNFRFFIYAVTHQSIEPNPDKNYEAYEIIGDRFLYAAMSNYLRERFPKITESIVNNYFQKVLSKPYQAKICVHLGLSNWGILPYTKKYGMIKPNAKFNEDMLEAFFGVIPVVLKREKKSIYIFDFFDTFMKLLFDKRKFDTDSDSSENEKNLNNITYCQQYFASIIPGVGVTGGLEEKEETIVLENGHTEFKVRVYQTPENIEYIEKTYGIKINNRLLGEARDRFKKEAKNSAYKKVREKLEKYGLTYDFKDEIKKRKRFGEIGYDYVLKYAKKMNNDIVDIYLDEYPGDILSVLNINAILEDGRKIVLTRKIFKNSEENTKQDYRDAIVEEYIEQIKKETKLSSKKK